MTLEYFVYFGIALTVIVGCLAEFQMRKRRKYPA